jgi:hypothetical protein
MLLTRQEKRPARNRLVLGVAKGRFAMLGHSYASPGAKGMQRGYAAVSGKFPRESGDVRRRAEARSSDERATESVRFANRD